MNTVKYTTVLLIDDNKIDNLIHTRVIQSVSFAEKILAHESPVEALQFLRNSHSDTTNLPNLIFLDINMPEMTGFEFLEEFDKLSPQITSRIKVIILSSSLNAADKAKAAHNQYVIKFISKPLSKEALQQL